MRSVALVLFPGATACAGQFADQAVVLRFDVQAGDEIPSCFVSSLDASFTPEFEIGSTATIGQLADARMLVSNVQLRNEAGDWVTLATRDAFPWRKDGVTLLDFEEGSSFCAANGTPLTNKNISGRLPEGSYRGLRFDIGVPFESNHVDFIRSDAPSPVEAMFIDVQNGYRFLRLEWVLSRNALTRYRVEVGEGGCDSADVDTAPASCARSNTATITLDDFVLGDNAVSVDIAAMVGGLDLDVPLGEETGCTSYDSDREDCGPVLEALGVAPDTGTCENDCSGQTIFGLTDVIIADEV